MKTLRVLGSRPAFPCARLPASIHPFYGLKKRLKIRQELIKNPAKYYPKNES
jgi:hypothetical protein